MKKFFLTKLFLMSLFLIQGQVFEIDGGISYTSYLYKNSKGEGNDNIQPSTGGFLSMTVNSFTLFNSSINYGLKIVQKNSTGGNQTQAYNWDTYYGTIFLEKPVISFKKNFSSNLQTGFSSMVYGKQQIGGNRYRLSESKEFNGLWINIGIKSKIKIKEFSAFQIYGSYMIDYGLKIGDQGNEELKFITHMFGVVINPKNLTNEQIDQIEGPKILPIQTYENPADQIGEPKIGPIETDESPNNVNLNLEETEIYQKVEIDAGVTSSTFEKTTIFFDLDKSELTKGSYYLIERLSNYLKNHVELRISITGYADSKTGGRDYNIELSKNRAKNVVDILIDMGIDKSRMKITYPGPTDEFGKNYLGLNRRVDIEIIYD